LGALDRAAANDHSRELVADRKALHKVSAQIIDFEKARAARTIAAGTAADGMAAFKARFQQNQERNARIEAERERMANEMVRVAQERAALERQERAKELAKQASHDDLSVKRDGPEFGM